MSKDIKKQVNLQKQQWVKALSNHISINLALKNPESPLKKSYDNSYYCNQIKEFDGEKMRSSYCKNRWCITCNRIRTAININHYGKTLSEFGQPMFVTLTRPTCTAEELPSQLKHFGETWRKIYKYANDKRRTPNIYLKGIRSLECTLRPNGKYHLHMHIILEGFTNAHWLVTEWLKRNLESNEKAQDVRSANTGSMVELFKYSVKLSKELLETPEWERLDSVFQVMKGKRLLSAFGGLSVLPQEDQEDFDIVAQGYEELQLRFGNETSLWKWDDGATDWINVNTGELLINEELPEKVKRSISN